MQPITGTKIAALNGLNKSTVPNVTSELLNEDHIYEKASDKRRVGRTPRNLYLEPKKTFQVKVNIGSFVTRLREPIAFATEEIFEGYRITD